ncbi:MAG: hypothetical protein AB8B85_01185 [Paracoccaceae bacterium]
MAHKRLGNSWPTRRRITVIADPPSWFSIHADALVAGLIAAGHDAVHIADQTLVGPGDIAFYLSCTGITPPERLALNRFNIVVHASALPEGRGFSPLVWQVLEGRHIIPLTMITMTEAVDAGDILMQRDLVFQGHELNDEMRTAMGAAIVGMCHDFAAAPVPAEGQPQQGTGSWYRRRGPEDSRLDPDRTLAEQFDLMRVVDNDRYPAFFDHRGHRYTLRIDRVSPDTGQKRDQDPRTEPGHD